MSWEEISTNSVWCVYKKYDHCLHSLRAYATPIKSCFPYIEFAEPGLKCQTPSILIPLFHPSSSGPRHQGTMHLIAR